jgi:hypothetical protein
MSYLTSQFKTARGKRYYTILNQIQAEIGVSLAADFANLREKHGNVTPVMVGWLALRYDVNLKAMFEILNNLKLLPSGIYKRLGVKVGEVFEAARKFEA